jgi:Zn-dependent peptidase ImmA (M78 family)
MESHGVRVFSLVDACRDIDAFSFWRDGTPYVFLNTGKSSERSRMDAAHELAHLVLHHRSRSRANNILEREAQVFGAAFLMPKPAILATSPRTGRLPELLVAKKYWNVALVSLIYRMHSLGLLTEWQYRSLFVEASSLGYRHEEPDSAPRETSQVLETVFRALWLERTTLRDVADELNLYPDDLANLVFGLVQPSTDVSSNGEQPSLRLV